MSSIPAVPSEPQEPEPGLKATSPVWHTVGVLLLLGVMAVLSLRQRTVDPAVAAQHRVLAYSFAIASEWIIIGFIALGARWGGASLGSLAGRFAPTWRSVGLDLGISAAYLVLANIILGVITAVLGHFIHSSPNAVLKNIFPHTGLEIATFLLLSLTAGICEETIFRGYLQRQFTALTGSAAAGIALQGVFFGMAHAYQGVIMVIVIAFYGCMFGTLAWWRKSLRPGMMAHFLQDAIGGIVLARFLTK